MVLSDLTQGERCMIVNIRRGTGAIRRLADLGILSGVVVKVLAHYPAGGPILLQVGDSHVAVGRALGSAIEVRRVS